MKKLLTLLILGALTLSLNAKYSKPPQKQESSGAIDWVASWSYCGGDGAIKRDGTLWEFGNIGYCNDGQILPIDQKTGKPLYKTEYIYHLKGRKIGSGFRGAKVINARYRVYAIKRDGSLWAWGEESRKKPRLLSKNHHWRDIFILNVTQDVGTCHIGFEKDGSLWAFSGYCSKIKKFPHKFGNKKWDKVILECCRIYAMAKNGTIWKNEYTERGAKFKRAVNIPSRIKNRFKRMRHNTMINLQEDGSKVKFFKRGGTLWLDPEEKYKF